MDAGGIILVGAPHSVVLGAQPEPERQRHPGGQPGDADHHLARQLSRVEPGRARQPHGAGAVRHPPRPGKAPRFRSNS
eukprot:2690840-Pyramimonas_sp.AAC.2